MKLVVQRRHNWRKFLKDIWTCLRTSCIFISFDSWWSYLMEHLMHGQVLYDVLLEPEHYTETEAGKSNCQMKLILYNSGLWIFLDWFGFSSSLAGIVGGLGLSYIADSNRRFNIH